MQVLDKASLTRLLVAIAGVVKLFGFDVPDELIDTTVDAVAALAVLYATWKDNDIKPSTIQWKRRFREFAENMKNE